MKYYHQISIYFTIWYFLVEAYAGPAANSNALEFEALVAPVKVFAPREGEKQISSFLLILKITNKSDAPIVINKYGFCIPCILGSEGKRMASWAGADHIVPATICDFVRLDAYSSTYISVNCSLLKGNSDSLVLQGQAPNGSFWEMPGLKNGKCQLALFYKSHPSDISPKLREMLHVDPWYGAITTPPISVIFE